MLFASLVFSVICDNWWRALNAPIVFIHAGVCKKLKQVVDCLRLFPIEHITEGVIEDNKMSDLAVNIGIDQILAKFEDVDLIFNL